MSRLQKHYSENVKKQMQDKFNYKNKNMVPKIEKVVLNCCHRDCVQNGKVAENIVNDLTAISGQKAMLARAKKSVASFKLREGMPIGGTVTLRGKRMYDFIDRLVSVSLPRVRDFRGISAKGFDGRGNYTLGLKEQIIFPEINYDKVDKVRGLGISFITTATTNDEGRELLRFMGLPFKKD